MTRRRGERVTRRRAEVNQPLVVAYGGGVNSTAMLIGMKQRGICPNLILMANTGGETPETYRWLSTFAAWLRDNGMPELQIVTNDGMYESLEHECLEKTTLPSLAYGFKSCSDKYKRRPQDKFVRTWPAAKAAWSAGLKVVKAIGYDADEPHRAGILEDNEYVLLYPLIKWGWGRDQCIDAIQTEGLPVPPKSACFFCPAMKKHEVIDLKNRHPDLFARAVQMEERAAANLGTIKGLGRNWSWKALGEADDAQMSLADFRDPMDEPCGCYDGDYEGIHESVVELSVSAGCKRSRGEK